MTGSKTFLRETLIRIFLFLGVSAFVFWVGVGIVQLFSLKSMALVAGMERTLIQSALAEGLIRRALSPFI